MSPQMQELRDQLDRLRSENAILRAALEAARIDHITCEDGWYACPASGECIRDGVKGCECGADEHNAKIGEALAGSAGTEEET